MNKLSPLRIQIKKLSTTNRKWSKSCLKPDYGPMEVQRSCLSNGIRLAAAKPMGAQIGACTIMFQAGTRYEIDDEIGASHFLRVASSGSGLSYTSYIKSRYLIQHGADLTCTNDRQTMAFTLRCPVTKFPDLKRFLLDTAFRGCYQEHEIANIKPLLIDDLHRLHPEQRVIDLAQRACWGGPLSNSTLCEPERIKAMSGRVLSNFTQRNMKPQVCTIGSVGVPFEETMKLAEMVQTQSIPSPVKCEACSFPRRGYEVYDLGPNSTTWIALVVPGCGTCDLRTLAKYSIIAATCGTGNAHMGDNSLDRTPQTPLGLMSGRDIYTSYKAFNISYNDIGVFGILAKTRAVSAQNAAVAASEFLAHIGELSFSQIEIGKRRLKLGLAMSDEDSVKITESLCLQLVNNTQMESSSDAIALVDCITPADISGTAKQLANKCCHMAVAVVGDVTSVPHDRELVCG